MESGQFPKLDDVVKKHVLAAIDMAGGSKAKAAELLGVSVKTVYNHVNRYSTETGETTQTLETTQSSSGEEVDTNSALPTGNNGSSIFG